MRERIRAGILSVLIMVFAVSACQVGWSLFEYQEGAEIYAEAEDLVKLPDLSQLPIPTPGAPSVHTTAVGTGETAGTPADGGEEAAPAIVYIDPYADALRDMDFAALREVNSQVLGWILVPGTGISYPVVQGENNSFYLNHTWRLGRNSVGAIFMECQNHSDLSDFNTIIYGHRMNNRSMFGILSNYKRASYWSAHPCVYYTDDSGTRRYDIFAAYEVSTEGDTYRLGFAGERDKQAFLDYCLGQSAIETGLVPTVYDQILTLSTCTGNGHATRWVVQAVCWGERPADPPEEENPPEGETPPEGENVPPLPEETDAPPADPEPAPGESEPPEGAEIQPPAQEEPAAQPEPAPEPDTPAETDGGGAPQ